MPEHEVFRVLAAWIQDFALLCVTVKPALLVIVESMLFFVGLATVVRFALRGR